MFTWLFVVPTKAEEEEPALHWPSALGGDGQEGVGKQMMYIQTRQFDSSLGKQRMVHLWFHETIYYPRSHL